MASPAGAMTFKPAIWFPVAVGLCLVNLVAVGFAAVPGEPWHAATHAALAVAFGSWAQRLRARLRGEGSQLQPQLESLELELSRLRQELGETQERLDFAERLLAQGVEARRGGPQQQPDARL